MKYLTRNTRPARRVGDKKLRLLDAMRRVRARRVKDSYVPRLGSLTATKRPLRIRDRGVSMMPRRKPLAMRRVGDTFGIKRGMRSIARRRGLDSFRKYGRPASMKRKFKDSRIARRRFKDGLESDMWNLYELNTDVSNMSEDLEELTYEVSEGNSSAVAQLKDLLPKAKSLYREINDAPNPFYPALRTLEQELGINFEYRDPVRVVMYNHINGDKVLEEVYEFGEYFTSEPTFEDWINVDPYAWSEWDDEAYEEGTLDMVACEAFYKEAYDRYINIQDALNFNWEKGEAVMDTAESEIATLEDAIADAEYAIENFKVGDRMPRSRFKDSRIARRRFKDEDVDKRAIIKKILELGATPDDEFEGGEDEKFDAMLKELEKVAYDNSENGKEVTDAGINKRELIRRILEIGNTPDDEFEGGEDEKFDAMVKELDSLADGVPSEAAQEEKAQTTDRRRYKDSAIKQQQKVFDAYNKVRPVTGDFNYQNMSEYDIYQRGLNALGVQTKNIGNAGEAFRVAYQMKSGQKASKQVIDCSVVDFAKKYPNIK